jgi:glycosyltransferase involved in cell wall biosynthesis
MRIGILAHDLISAEPRGLARYTEGLVRALLRQPDTTVVLFSRAKAGRELSGIETDWIVWPGRREVLWEQFDLPRQIRRLNIDLLHAPSNRGLPLYANCPMVLTRHDEIERMFPPDFPGSARSRFRMLYSDEISIRRAERIITPSECSRQDVLRKWRLHPSRVINCGEGIDERFYCPVSIEEIDGVRNRWALDRAYILYVGGFDKRKDVRTLLDAFFLMDSVDHLLVLAGPLRGEGESLREIVKQHPRCRSVRILGHVADEDLPPLYAGADVFVYPSRYEGFGLQVMEAMAIGTPVVVSDGGSLPEVASDAALVFSAGKAHDCARAIADMLGGRQDSFRKLGRLRAEQFRWDNIIPNYLNVYRELLS